jgi:hypothetical protein
MARHLARRTMLSWPATVHLRDNRAPCLRFCPVVVQQDRRDCDASREGLVESTFSSTFTMAWFSLLGFGPFCSAT